MLFIYQIVFTGQPNLWFKSLQGKYVSCLINSIRFLLLLLISSALSVKRNWGIFFLKSLKTNFQNYHWSFFDITWPAMFKSYHRLYWMTREPRLLKPTNIFTFSKWEWNYNLYVISNYFYLNTLIFFRNLSLLLGLVQQD